MKLVALLRGINAGKINRIDMKNLRILFESLGYSNVSTYINSGNVIFESEKKPSKIRSEIESGLKRRLGLDIPIIIKTKFEMKSIADSIPKAWLNDSKQRTDVAYLFNSIDSEKILSELPVNTKYIKVGYTKGALYWNVKRRELYKSRLNKLISHRLYQSMTIRNINTARKLA
jgi:uncharacterized protein (DUF1697 family)